ncbi:hypothetical protein [Alcanivorax sp. 1008]|uniref:hypothetical protein n=1 Tax=Alcanivorax sp. 1008 TaxID=2816853 RepID=UPI001D39162A|nr:hypothetical protein [Alcanivorax sp. 1008]MCC1498189.1 hypothetical protein [Alcanivorax sp. 1008]
MKPLAPRFQEEYSAKIPALKLLANLGWELLSPEQALLARGGKADKVVLRQVLRTELKKRTFTFAGKDYPLSNKTIDNLVADVCTPALNECLFGHQTRQQYPPGDIVAGIPKVKNH